MAQRFSGYERREREFYPTPEWVTRALMSEMDLVGRSIWEPASGNGDMALIMRDEYGNRVFMSDLEPGPRIKALDAVTYDFLGDNPAPWPDDFTDIITNPPYGLGGRMARDFIERSLTLTQARRGLVAMLLKDNYDSAIGRKPIFGNCPTWSKKLVLTRRIVWFETGNGNGPSENHAWYIWDWRHEGPPRLAYWPK